MQCAFRAPSANGPSMRRVVITGGPCSGKTTTVEALRSAGFQVIPEAAEIVLTGWVEAYGLADAKQRRSRRPMEFQAEIFRVQLELEARNVPASIVVMDRSGIDGIAYLERAGLEARPEMVRYAREARFSHVFLLETLPRELFRTRAVTGRLSTYEDSVEVAGRLSEVYGRFGNEPILVSSRLSAAERVAFIGARIGSPSEAWP